MPQYPLGHYGITYGRADKGRKVEVFTKNTVGELEQFIGKGKLLIIPNRDLPVPSNINDTYNLVGFFKLVNIF